MRDAQSFGDKMPLVMGQAVVFGRPNEAFAELMHLEEATLQEILLAGSVFESGI